MEIGITDFVEHFENDMHSFSDSVHGSGLDNIGAITWRNARIAGRDWDLLDSDELVETAREFFRGFGAWDADEVDSWTHDDLNAMTIQQIASDYRNHYEDKDGPAYLADDGSTGNLYRDQKGEWTFLLSH